MKRLGIVGGLGPETSCIFCLNVNNRIIEKTEVQPDILMENVPMPESVLQKLAHGKKPQRVLALLSQSVTRLNIAGCDIICIPCNTVHVFIEDLRAISKAPIISIIEESVKECKRKGFKKAGLLASTTSIRSRLHIDEMKKRNISWIIPTDKQQKEISDIIVKVVTNKVNLNDKEKLRIIIRDIENQGTDCIMLACTDLRTIISEQDTKLPIIETTTALENAVVKELLKK